MEDLNTVMIQAADYYCITVGAVLLTYFIFGDIQGQDLIIIRCARGGV